MNNPLYTQRSKPRKKDHHPLPSRAAMHPASSKSSKTSLETLKKKQSNKRMKQSTPLQTTQNHVPFTTL